MIRSISYVMFGSDCFGEDGQGKPSGEEVGEPGPNRGVEPSVQQGEKAVFPEED